MNKDCYNCSNRARPTSQYDFAFYPNHPKNETDTCRKCDNNSNWRSEVSNTLNSTINRAYLFAKEKHERQIDDNHKPHDLHSTKVALLVSLITSDPEIIAAAYLHDILEDTDITRGQLEELFGKEISDLVFEVTHVRNKKDDGWCFPNLKSAKAIQIKLADRLDNISRMEVWDAERQLKYLKKTKFWDEE